MRSGARAASIGTVLERAAFAPPRTCSVIPVPRRTRAISDRASPGCNVLYHPRSCSSHAIGPRLAHLVSPGAPSARLARAPCSSRPSVSAHLRALVRVPRDTVLVPTAPSRSVTRRYSGSARIGTVAQGHERAVRERRTTLRMKGKERQRER